MTDVLLMQVPVTEKRLKNRKPHRRPPYHRWLWPSGNIRMGSLVLAATWALSLQTAVRGGELMMNMCWRLTVMSIFAFTLIQQSLPNEFQMTFVSPRGPNLLRKQHCDPENWRKLLLPLFKMQKSLTTYFRTTYYFGKRCWFWLEINALWIRRGCFTE